MTGSAGGDRFSAHEQLMWDMERDPFMNPNAACLMLLDSTVDIDQLRERLKYTVIQTPRLLHRVIESVNPIEPPIWMPDAEFDLDRHFRVQRVPAPGGELELFAMATRLAAEPLDRRHPLWRFVVIDGLASGAHALWMIVHHVIGDGHGQVRMAAGFTDLEADAEPPAPVDLDAFVADAVEASGPLPRDIDLRAQAQLAGHMATSYAETARRVLGELALWPADPQRARDRISSFQTFAESALSGMRPPASSGSTSGASLWKARSANRHLEHVSVPFDAFKAGAKSRGASINEAYMAAMIQATVSYHQERETPVASLTGSFVLSTRKKGQKSANAFTPVAVRFSGEPMTLTERMASVAEDIAAAREAAADTGGISALSGVANMVPTAAATRFARSQAAGIDFATSNVPGWAGMDLFITGTRLAHTIVQGPVAGTPVNATAISGGNTFDVGLHIDPVAIAEPEAFAALAGSALAEVCADDS